MLYGVESGAKMCYNIYSVNDGIKKMPSINRNGDKTDTGMEGRGGRMSYSSAGILALIIHLIINNDVLRKRVGKEVIPAHRPYRALMLSVTAYYVADILWGFLYERHLTALVFADTVFYFIAMAFTILLWTRFVIAYLQKDNRFARMLNVAGQLIFAFQLAVVFVNFFFPILFTIDGAGAYHALAARYVNLAVQIAMFAITAVYAISVTARSRGTVKFRHRTIGLFSAAMAGFVTGQAFYPLLPLYAIGCLLGGCLLHSFVLENEKEEYRDDLEERLRESLEKGNYYDLLTGLPSMTYFFELADSEKDATLKRGGEPALLYMDFNGMKFFNQKYGFSEGDRLLQAFAKVLVRHFGNDHCCRIGGDHFAVITVAQGLENRLHQLFSECQDMNDGKSLPVHVGIYSGQEGHIHASIACDRAKLACSELNGAYASCFNYFSQALSDDAERKQYIIENFDRAIDGKWIKVYYQPIVRATKRKVCEEEALSRWIDPVRGFLSPADFIPALEASGLIYRLDLYVLERALEKIRYQQAAGITGVPQSINLSRSDFDACDIVEEIRKRVDGAGIGHDRITIEITESLIGSDFDFIKEQVLRFRNLGFPVWIDDFGSGYSSLDVLQSLKFDLIKFDMGFIRRLDESDSSRIILTELVQMATSLGVDTVCEGVETEEQAVFLEEIGCSRLQGYYFSKPAPFEKDPEKGGGIDYENPGESAYYDAIGRVNLYDLSSIVGEDESVFQGIFNTFPMSIIEVRDGKGQYVRSNQSYRDFMKRYFGLDISGSVMDFSAFPVQYGLSFIRIVHQCCVSGNRAFFDEKMADGSTVHCFVRRISQNAVTGTTAIAIAVLSISDPDEGASYADIARALATDYYSIYIVDLDTERFIEYASNAGGDELAVERHGADFFETARRDANTRIYEEDRELFMNWFSRENIVRELDERGVFTATYRLIDTGVPVYVNMKVTRLQPGGSKIIMGISVVDAQMKQKEHYDALQRERSTLVRVMALTDGYLSRYTVEPDTGYYVEYTCSDDFATLGAPKEGYDFFRQLIDNAPTYLHPDDQSAFLEQFSRERVMDDIRERGHYSIRYHIMIKGEPKPVVLRIAPFRDGEAVKLLVGVRSWMERR